MRERIFVVAVPVADLRKEPVDAASDYLHDDLQGTQVLYNERLRFVEEYRGWYYVEAPEQEKIEARGVRRGYPGWVRKDYVVPAEALPELNAVVKKGCTILTVQPDDEAVPLAAFSIGTRLLVKESAGDYCEVVLLDGRMGRVKESDINRTGSLASFSETRQGLMDTAASMLGTPYLWGGRSACVPRLAGDASLFGMTTDKKAGPIVLTGIDCSGLVNLVYRAWGQDIPRDAQDQWQAAVPIASHDLTPADLIFVSAEGDHDRIIHVMLSRGKAEFVEASEPGYTVACSSFQGKYGLTLSEIAARGFIVGHKRISFGRFLETGFEAVV